MMFSCWASAVTMRRATVLSVGLGPYRLKEFEARHVRHVPVGHDEIEFVDLELGEGGSAVLRLPDLLVADSAEDVLMIRRTGGKVVLTTRIFILRSDMSRSPSLKQFATSVGQPILRHRFRQVGARAYLDAPLRVHLVRLRS